MSIIEEMHSRASLVWIYFKILGESSIPTSEMDFDNIMDAHLGLVGIELEQSFSDGFKTGIRLMHESFEQYKNDENN